MLVIAIPKSASTSLQMTLGNSLGLPAHQEFLGYLRPVKEFGFLGKHHSDCRDIPPEYVARWRGTDAFFKQHVPPTCQNLTAFNDCKKVVLLRPAEDIVLAYRRAAVKNIGRSLFGGLLPEDVWIQRAKNCGLYRELEAFNNVWRNVSSDKLVIEFEELVGDPGETVAKIAEYFGLKWTKRKIKLSKALYSRS